MNEYYTYGDTLVGGTTANAEDVAAEFNGIVAGLDKFPTEAQLKSGQLNYAVDTGTANTYVITMPQVPLSLYDGYTLAFKVANTNTSTCTLNVDGLGAKALVNTDGSVLQAGDLVAGSIVTTTYDGTKFQVTNALQGIINFATDARDAAVVAQGLAETAQGLAETAQTNAETAETNAETAEANAQAWAETVNIPTVVGQSGKYLTNNGTTKSWATVSTYADLLSTTTLSGQSYVDMSISGSYTSYIVEFLNVAGSSALNYWLRTSPNGSSFDLGGSDYSYVLSYSDGVTGPSGVQAAGSPYVILTQNSPTKFCGRLQIFNPAIAAYTQMTWDISGYAATTMQRINGTASRLSAAAVYKIRILPSGGNLASGIIKVYGVK